MKHSFNTSTTPAQIVEAVDFSDELDALGGTLEVPGAKRIRKSGFYNKASRRPAGGTENYALKAESSWLVKLSDGTTAVASRDGVVAYAARTGQTVPETV